MTLCLLLDGRTEMFCLSRGPELSDLNTALFVPSPYMIHRRVKKLANDLAVFLTIRC